MPMPTDIGVVDLMIGFPDPNSNLDYLKPLFHDEESRNMAFPAQYMFKEVPEKAAADADPVAATLAEMDRYNVAIGLVNVGGDIATRALKEHPDRFAGCVSVDPNDITGAVRRIRQAHSEFGVKAVTSFPAGCIPQVPVSDRRYYPVYQTCIDLDIPMIINAGVPGPRVPMKCQHVEHFDEVCYDFPELRIVMRHGSEPWQELAVKLMLKWPGLYYMPSAFAPRHYPKAIVDFANTRGADKIMYAGYYPMGLTLERIFRELPDVGFKPEVWPKFLRENAIRVLKLDV
jgi:predicted TIM-barrel fold metal-dependent hydrolase